MTVASIVSKFARVVSNQITATNPASLFFAECATITKMIALTIITIITTITTTATTTTATLVTLL